MKRNGYYGKDKRFVLWVCAGGEGDRPHQIRPGFSTRLVGGAEGACDHCERRWEPTDGLPQAVGDRFVLRQKAETLVALGRGMSYRQAAWEARRTAGHPARAGASGWFSDDRRMTGDWVGQHAEIVAAPLLPERWPKIVAIDELELRLLRFRPDGTRVQRGGEAYTVMGVVGYEDEHSKGAAVAARRSCRPRQGRLGERVRRASGQARDRRLRRRLGGTQRRRRPLARG